MKFYFSFIVICLMALKSLPSTVADSHNPGDSSRLHNSSYSITVAIQSFINEDSAIIDRLKKYMNATSYIMLEALDRRAYIRNVTIILPSHWKGFKDISSAGPGLTYKTADFQVGLKNSEEDWLPFLRQKENYTCGEPSSKPIYIPVEYFLKDESCVYEHGDPGKKLTVIFAKYRFGIFDENPGNAYPHFEESNGLHLKPTPCNSEIKGISVRKGSNETCAEFGDAVNSECEFIPNTTQEGATASLLYSDKIKSVVKFCSNDSFTLTRHNEKAENLHNKNCGKKSAWEVIRDSPDFKDRTLLPPGFNATPTFKLVQDIPKHVAIVMDTSGSMKDENKIQKLRTVGEYFIKHALPNDYSYSLIDFDDDAVVILQLTRIRDESDRVSGTEKLPTPLDAKGGTCIDCGLEKGLESLQASSRSAYGHRLLVLTDGIGDVSSSVTNRIIAAGLTVDTILFSIEQPHPLQQLSHDTKGMTYFCSNETRVDICLKESFRKTIDERLDSDSLISHLIKTGTFNKTSKTQRFIVDSTLGNETELEIYFPSLTTERLTVYPPRGSPITEGNSQYIKNTDHNTTTVKFDGIAEAGIYEFNISRMTFSGDASWEVRSKARSPMDSPITLTPSHKRITKNGGFWLVLMAEITWGHSPVVGATVKAIVSVGNFHFEEIIMTGDNIGADLAKEDGIYSAYFKNFTRAGKYTYHIIAGGGSASFLVAKNHYYCSTEKRRKRDVHGYTETLEEAPDFHRESPGNFFEIDSPLTGSQSKVIPPSKIKDLMIVNGTAETSVIMVLTWTAVGEDLMDGYATKYKLCYAENTSLLIRNWNHCSYLNESQVINGDLYAPQKARTKELLGIELPLNSYNEGVWSIAVAAIDGFGNEGEISNVVVSNFRVPPPPTTTTEQPTTTTTEPPTTTIDGVTTTKPNITTAYEIEDILIVSWYQKTSVISPLIVVVVLALVVISGICVTMGYKSKKCARYTIQSGTP